MGEGVSCIVRRINVNALQACCMAFIEAFQYGEVVSLNQHISFEQIAKTQLRKHFESSMASVGKKLLCRIVKHVPKYGNAFLPISTCFWACLLFSAMAKGESILQAHPIAKNNVFVTDQVLSMLQAFPAVKTDLIVL